MSEKDLFEKIVESPAVALDKTAEMAEKMGKAMLIDAPGKKTKAYWDLLGPLEN